MSEDRTFRVLQIAPDSRRFMPYGLLYLVALLCYAPWWAALRCIVPDDSYGYLEMGRGIFEAGVFGFKGEDGHYYPNAFRMPAIPFVLGLIFRIVSDNQRTFAIYAFIQLFIAPILPCIAYYFGNKISRPVAWLAFGLMLINPNVIACMLNVLTDTPFAAVSGFAFVQLWRCLENPSSRKSFIAGLLAGLGCFLRPIMKLYWVVAAVLMLVHRKPASRYLKSVAAFVVAFFIMIAPWLVRTTGLYGRPVFETNQGLNLLWSNFHLVELKASDSPETRQIKEWIFSHKDLPMYFVEYKGRPYWLQHDLDVSRDLGRVAMEAYKDHPLSVARTWLGLAVRMTCSSAHASLLCTEVQKTSGYKWLRNTLGQPVDTASTAAYKFVRYLTMFLYGILAWVGLAIVFLRNRRLAVFMLLHIAYFTVLTAFVAGYDRYRLNIEVFYMVLISVALVTITQRLFPGKSA